ncbi:hypothetical protein OG762_36380 [Streptomyces sp. NBC_01136]|nr:hypothetical protein OG762_36380 [Streptomyces sp. NBC_01136]
MKRPLELSALWAQLYCLAHTDRARQAVCEAGLTVTGLPPCVLAV